MSFTSLGALIRRAKANDKDALEELFSHVRPWLREELGHMYRSCGLPFADGSDVAQDACLKAINAFDEFPGEHVTDLYRWLRGIARNCSVDLQRFEHAAIRNVRKRVCGSEIMTGLVAAEASVVDRVIRDEEAAQVMAAIEQLNAKDQDVLRERFFEQKSFSEIAAQTGEIEGTVRQRCLRALTRLRTVLGD